MADKVEKVKLQWFEFPMRIVVKRDGGAEEFVRKGSVCFSPPIEVVPDPMREDAASLLSTQFGTKVIEEPYSKLMKKLYDA